MGSPSYCSALAYNGKFSQTLRRQTKEGHRTAKACWDESAIQCLRGVVGKRQPGLGEGCDGQLLWVPCTSTGNQLCKLLAELTECYAVTWSQSE